MAASPSGTSRQDQDAWRLLVNRSIAAWATITAEEPRPELIHRTLLEESPSLDYFFKRNNKNFIFRFFQLRKAFELQDHFRKWSPRNLNNYIILPASPGYVKKRDCVFVSHYWQSHADPDPDGEVLRQHQATLANQQWRYIWVDWTCMPQSPRSEAEEAYFVRTLPTMSAIIRNCSFAYHYPNFEPRLWISYEITEFLFTCDDPNPHTAPDMQQFRHHVDAMAVTSVRRVLRKNGYRCSYDRDRQLLTSWLELLVLLRRLRFHVTTVQRVMDHMTWHPSAPQLHFPNGGLEVKKLEGTLSFAGRTSRFTPFPQWKEGKYASGTTA